MKKHILAILLLCSASWAVRYVDRQFMLNPPSLYTFVDPVLDHILANETMQAYCTDRMKTKTAVQMRDCLAITRLVPATKLCVENVKLYQPEQNGLELCAEAYAYFLCRLAKGISKEELNGTVALMAAPGCEKRLRDPLPADPSYWRFLAFSATERIQKSEEQFRGESFSGWTPELAQRFLQLFYFRTWGSTINGIEPAIAHRLPVGQPLPKAKGNH